MPIKYNLTKYDLLAEKYHELSQKKDQFTQDEENIRAQAILIASFSSSHSWNTNRLIMEGNPNLFLNSTDMIIAEHILSKASKWKQVKNTDIQEVARININGIFPIWLNSIKVDQQTRETYRNAWKSLNEEVFSAECDGNTVATQNSRF